MSYIMQPPALPGAQTTSASLAPGTPSASLGPPASATMDGGGGGYVSTFQSPQQSFMPGQPSQPYVPPAYQPQQPGGTTVPGARWPGQPPSGGMTPSPQEAPGKPGFVKSFWVQTRFGGRAWTDDLMYADYGVAVERASHHAKHKPESDRDLIAVGRGDAYICRYTVGGDGNWVSDCPGAGSSSLEGLGGLAESMACEDTGGKFTAGDKWWLPSFLDPGTCDYSEKLDRRSACLQAFNTWDDTGDGKCITKSQATYQPSTFPSQPQPQSPPVTQIVLPDVVIGGAKTGGLTPAYTPQGGGPKNDTIMGLPKMAVYVGAGSLALLGVAIFMKRKR